MPGQNHSRLVASGVMLDGQNAVQEIFSFGIALVSVGAGTPDGGSAFVPPAARQALADSCAAYFRDASIRISARCRLDQVKVNDFAGLDGKQVNQDTFVAGYAQTGGSIADPTFPPQVSLAVSTRTAQRGPSARGRFYLPPQGFAASELVTATKRLQPNIRDQISVASRAWMRALIAAGGLPVIASAVRGNIVINAVDVGDVFDTLRTRRNKLMEGRTTSPI